MQCECFQHAAALLEGHLSQCWPTDRTTVVQDGFEVESLRTDLCIGLSSDRMMRRVFDARSLLPVSEDIVFNCVHLFVRLIGSFMFRAIRLQFSKRLHLLQ